MAELQEIYVGQNVHLSAEDKELTGRSTVRVKIYEKDNPGNVLYTDLVDVHENKINFTWTVKYNGDMNELKEGKEIKYIFEVDNKEAKEIILKADFFRLKFQYENPLEEGKFFPLPKDIKVFTKIKLKRNYNPYCEETVKIQNNKGELDILSPGSPDHVEGLYFDIEFNDKMYVNMTDNFLLTETEFKSKIREDKEFLKNKMVFVLNRKYCLGNEEWEIDRGYDKDKNMITTVDETVTITLKLKWKHIRFNYYDFHAKTEKFLPQYPLFNVETGYIIKKTASKSNICQDGVIFLPWRDDIDNPHIFYELNREIFVKSPDTLELELAIDDFRKMDTVNRVEYFRVPKKWDAGKWQVSFDGNDVIYEDAIKETTSKDKPVIFNLGAIVLSNGSFHPVGFRQNDRFTIFDLKGNVIDPDPDYSYWHKKADLEDNFFNTDLQKDGTALAPRLIALNGKFYDIMDECIRGGHSVGARAAVLEDGRVHHKGDNFYLLSWATNPIAKYTDESGTGNFELHYLTGCLDTDNTTEISILLIYWSGSFKPDSAPNQPTGAQVENFYKSGMKNAKERWEQKGFLFKKKEGNDITVRPIYFFEGREKDPKKCDVTVTKDTGRSYMATTYAKFYFDTYKPSNPAAPYSRFTMAHELGHGTGLKDEYLEPIEEPFDNADVWYPERITQFSQYYPGMPYSTDDESMMESNMHPRMRHSWFYCRWLNENDTIKRLTENTKFQVDDSAGTGNTLFFENEHANYYKPVCSKKNVQNGTHGAFDLFLYKTGNEMPNTIIPGKTFDSILVVVTKIQWFFEDDGANSWRLTLPGVSENENKHRQKVKYLENFQKAVRLAFNSTFFLQNNTHPDFKLIYIFFLPYYHFEMWCLSEHFEITVKRNGQGPDTFFERGFVFKKHIKVGNSADYESIYRVTLGLSNLTGGSPPVPQNTIQAHELGFLADRVKEMLDCPGAYTVIT